MNEEKICVDRNGFKSNLVYLESKEQQQCKLTVENIKENTEIQLLKRKPTIFYESLLILATGCRVI